MKIHYLKGLKIRIGVLLGKLSERLDGVPLNLPDGEVYQSLEKGVGERNRPVERVVQYRLPPLIEPMMGTTPIQMNIAFLKKFADIFILY